ncbi:xanthine dehydrogenase accessory protein XdhC [Vibrio tritonius]|uniref:Xanthine dehydrogenase accessory protein XdhC n=1 Tax=Vibrio tritonius TaxID=1435069 RepID=A0ABS7YP37_9VIBR|nr:xanthine dehydrogenase accessory protein XdhC [Vibrio tritonius]MCA2017444.1 xanthine dehydrogenase accessory protein XdhC [Vibrio tritonius]
MSNMNDSHTKISGTHTFTDGKITGTHTLNWLSACQQLNQLGHPYCVATVIAHAGSVPRSSGAKMVISRTEQFDTLGGGHLEYQVIEHARKVLTQGNAEMGIERFALAADLGQCCGGAVQVLFEYFQTDIPRVVIFGAGHISANLCSILDHLPCHVTVIDSRQEWLDKLASTSVNRQYHTVPQSEISLLPSGSYLVIMTHDHQLDYELCKVALSEQRFAFVGLIGSQGKKQRFLYRLKEDLTDPQWTEQLTCPIGLDTVPGKLPMQVAVSIAGQLIQHFAMDKASEHTEPKESQSALHWQHANEVRKQLREPHHG